MKCHHVLTCCMLMAGMHQTGAQPTYRIDDGVLYTRAKTASDWEAVPLRERALTIVQSRTRPGHAVVATEHDILVTDGGPYWSTVHSRHDATVMLLVVSPHDPTVLFFVEESREWNGFNHSFLWRSMNGGYTWDCLKMTGARITNVVFDPADRRAMWYVAEEGPRSETMLMRKNREACPHGGPQGVWFSSSLGSVWTHFGMPPKAEAIVDAWVETARDLLVRTTSERLYRISAHANNPHWVPVESFVTEKR